MILGLLAFVGGVWLFQFQPRIPDPALFWLYPLPGLCALSLRWMRLPAWLVFGFAWAHGHAVWTAPPRMPGVDLDRPVWATGRVDSLVDQDGGRSRFLLRVARFEQDGRSFEGDWRLRVSWYRDAPAVAPGETWRLHLRMRAATGYGNPGGFDYPRWLYEQGVTHTASVRADPDNVRTAGPRGALLSRLRQHLASGTAAMGDGSSPALLRALVIGDRSGFDAAAWHAFRATGTSHLVAISGLHIGLVAGLAGMLANGAWRRLPRGCARVPAVQAGLLCGVGAAAAYAALAGFAVPTQRALLMLAVGALAWLSGWGRQPGPVLVVALALVAAWQPVALLSAGLWLSFAAVAAILWVVLPRQGGSRPRRWIGLQLALGLALMPLLLLFFGQASLAAPLVNLLAIPWFSLVLVPLALLAATLWLALPAAAEPLLHAWFWLGRHTLDALAHVATWDWIEVSLPIGDPGVLPLAGVGVLLLLAPRGVPGRWLGGLLLLPLLTRQPPPPAPGAFQLALLDVGQGLALVVRTARHVLVYDAGPRFRSGFDTGAAVVVPYLRARGVARIDALIASHADNDHAGGVGSVMKAFPVARLLSGEPARVPGAQGCRAGESWRWDGVEFRVLSPSAGGAAAGNNSSCVLRVDNGHASLLLSGDIEAQVEQELLARNLVSPTDVVVAPHHGSLSSSTPPFVAQLAPTHVLYATGRGNRWGFPKPAVVARWRTHGATSWDTARDGALIVQFPAQGGPLRVRTHRRRHYWQP